MRETYTGIQVDITSIRGLLEDGEAPHRLMVMVGVDSEDCKKLYELCALAQLYYILSDVFAEDAVMQKQKVASIESLFKAYNLPEEPPAAIDTILLGEGSFQSALAQIKVVTWHI